VYPRILLEAGHDADHAVGLPREDLGPDVEERAGSRGLRLVERHTSVLAADASC